MSTTETGNDPAAVASVPGTAAVPEPPDVLIGAGGDPLALGLSVFLIGALVLGMTFVGVFPVAATGVLVPVAVFTTGLLLLITAGWGVLRGESVLTGIFGTVAGLFLSFGVLVAGLDHNWFAIPPAAVPSAEAIFFIAFGCWFALLLVPSVKLPVIYTITIALVVIAIGLASAGLLAPSATLQQAAGGDFLAVAFCLAWLWLNTHTAAVGLKPWPPLGEPLA
jgi:hypothetical protein